MKYADKRGSPLVVIQGGDEKAKGEVTLKDLALGSQLARGVKSRKEYASQRLAQVSVPEAELVKAVKKPSPLLCPVPGKSKESARPWKPECRH